MCLAERKTDRRGRSAVPSSFLRIDTLRRVRADTFTLLIFFTPGMVAPDYAAPVLPTLRLMVSSRYLMPLPLYGSGGRNDRTLAAVCPRTSRSVLARVMMFFSTLALTPLGRT